MATKAPKTYTIAVTRYRLRGENSTRNVTGTLEYLISYFKYTLECGHSWEYEKGNKKINLNPKTIKSLITNLNNASANSCRSYQSEYFDLVA